MDERMPLERTESGLTRAQCCAHHRAGRAAARPEHRHGRARDGQLRPEANCASSIRATAGRTSTRARAASGADAIVDGARLFDTVAGGDRRLLAGVRDHGAGARPGEAGAGAGGGGAGDGGRDRRQGRAAILFGRERWGLTNDEVALADRIVTFPVDPEFASLNLAQAVLLMGYEWFKCAKDGALPYRDHRTLGAREQGAGAGVLRHAGRRARSRRIPASAGKARHHDRQPAQHFFAHGADPAGHADAARGDQGDRRGARRVLRAAACWTATTRRGCARCWRPPAPAACRTSRGRCAGLRGCCGETRRTPSACCGRR